MKFFLFMLVTAFSISLFAQNTSVVQVEYFFDADNGVGRNTVVNVTPAADGTFPFVANTSGLSAGYHKLYIRTKDGNGKWCLTARRNLEVFAPDAKTNIVSGEYFIDVDPGYGAAMPIVIAAPDSLIDLVNFTAATSGLSIGYHKLYGRMKDDLGRWSHTFRRNIKVYKNDTNYVYKAEYFFNTDYGYGNCTEVKFANPLVDGNFSFAVPPSQIPAGADTLFIRVQDSAEGKWSITALKGIPIILPLALLNFDVKKQNNTVLLAWQTTHEINTAYFNVQRSNDGRSFATVGKVVAKNSSGNNDYTFTDNINSLLTDRINYRLEMVDKDGKTSYSEEKYIGVYNSLQIAVNPNPVANGNALFTIYSPANSRLQLTVYNDVSKCIYSEEFTMQRGSMIKNINLLNLASGNYFIIVSDGKSMQTAKFIKL